MERTVEPHGQKRLLHEADRRERQRVRPHAAQAVPSRQPRADARDDVRLLARRLQRRSEQTYGSSPRYVTSRSSLRVYIYCSSQRCHIFRTVFHTARTYTTFFCVLFTAQDIANFLLSRGPHAWLGHGWLGCSRAYEVPEQINWDYGEPVGLCKETGANSGVFTREWTKATVQMDCNTWTPTITMKKK